jgi:sterol desaturase/sphingolipid hydroxylase (fatty acid hydroxylase superfamily)
MDELLRRLGDPARLFFAGYVFHLVRYLVIAGGAYVLFYVILRRRLLGRKMQACFPRIAQMRREELYSLLSFAVFAATGLLTLALFRQGWTRLYFDISARGWPWFWTSVAALIVIHDAWFYWTHRLMHARRLFPLVHRVHHLSHNPTPWAAFAFHPVEAAVQAIIFPLVVLVLPVHPSAGGLWLLYMTIMNVAGHLGFEVLPRGFVRHPLARWHNTPVHHDMHHRHFDCNYGLYFNLWDRLMGTNHPRYEAEYDRVTSAEAHGGGASAEQYGAAISGTPATSGAFSDDG